VEAAAAAPPTSTFTVSEVNDFYFDLVAGTTFTVRTYGNGVDSQLWLYDSSGTEVAMNDDSYYSLDSYISYIVPNSGRYRLRTGMFTYLYDPDFWSGTVSYIVETSWLNALTIATDEQGGSAINNAFTTTGGIISSSPGTPTRSGYTFNGWFTASSGGSALLFPYTHNQTENFTLYAQWTIDGIYSSCLDIKNATGTNTNGTYTIALNVGRWIVNTQVYCLMDSAMSGGGWTLTMKAPRNSTAFAFDANYWTTANTLNTLNLGNVTNDAIDAKFNTFNYLSGTEMLAIFPDTGINGGSVTGQTYGWTWKQTIPSGPKTPLEIFNGPMGQFIGDADNFSGFDTRIFSRQEDIRFYGFNWSDNLQSRWGFGWNENGGGLWPYGERESDDATGGIGLNWGYYSAGDGTSCCTTSVGLNRSMSFETYVR
jgi:uncharacterized repeat protein (TIGR02543 family)